MLSATVYLEVALSPLMVVRGDVLRVRAGDQIVVDGPLLDAPLLGGGSVEADESLLTGEAEPIVKIPGDDLRSGSLCVSGAGYQRARDVGAASYAGRLTAAARRASTDKTPLQRRIDFLVRLVMAIVVLMSGAILGQAAVEGLTLVRTVQIAAVLSGLVPYGLFFLIAIAYAAGAVKMGNRGALVQQVNAVESVSNVNVVCTDKTGTLTTGRFTVEAVEPVADHDRAAVEVTLAGLAGSAGMPNLTTAALAETFPDGGTWNVRDEVPFVSSLRWSGITTDDGSWVLGAPDALGPYLNGPTLDAAVSAHTALGLRVLILARATTPTSSLRDGAGRPLMPQLDPLAIVVLADQLRPEVADTVSRFRASGVALKVLSGDDPNTVAALSARAGIDAGEPVSGADLDALDDGGLDRVVARTSVFGRVAPEQKERIVSSLRRQGRYVAMIGDGVNDALALKKAQVGVAMRSGSSVTRDVADIVLVNDSFAALQPAQYEGRRIINGIAISLYVYLARVATQGLIILTVTLLGLGFPYSPRQVGLTLLTVGVPTLFLAFWARHDTPDDHLLRNLARFVIPAAVITAGFGTAVYGRLYGITREGISAGRSSAQGIENFERYTGLPYTDTDFNTASATIAAQSALSTFICLASFVLILFLAPPTRWFAAWTRPADRRPAILVAGLILALVAVLYVPTLSNYFGLTENAPEILTTVLPAVLLWFATMTAAYRFNVFDRVLGIDASGGPSDR